MRKPINSTKLHAELVNFILSEDWPKYCDFWDAMPVKRIRGGPKFLADPIYFLLASKKNIKRFRKYRKDL